MVSAMLLLAALVLAPIIGGGFGELTNAVLQILVFTAIVVNLISRSRNGEPSTRVPGYIPLIIFLAAVLISLVFSASVYASIKQLLFISACIGGYMLAADIARDKKAATALVWGVVISALGICGLEIRNYAINTGGGVKFWQALMSPGAHWRVFGTFVNPNFFAGFLVLTLPLTLGVYLVTRRSILAFVAGTAFAVECLALMLTGSKFGLVAGAVAMLSFLVLILLTKSLRRPQVPRIIVMSVILIPLLVLFSGSIRNRVGEAEEGGSQVHSSQFRAYTWKATLNMVRQNPLAGVGVGAFETAFPRYEIAGFTTHAHESYLQIAAESGVVALGAFVILLLYIAGGALKGIFRSASVLDKGQEEIVDSNTITWEDLIPSKSWRLIICAVFASLLGSGVHNLVDSDWYVIGIALPFWVLAGLLAARSGAVKESSVLSRRMGLSVMRACGLLMIFSLSLGIGDALVSDQFASAEAGPELIHRYELASHLSPFNPKYPRELAKFYYYVQNNPNEAISEIDRAIRMDRNNAVNYYVKGMIQAGDGNPASAADSMEKALALNPNSTQTLNALAMIYRSKGDIARSEMTLQRLLAIENTPYEQVKGVPEMVDVTYAYAHAYFGRKYLAEGKYQQAAQEYSKTAVRLEQWRSNKQMLEVKRAAGTLTQDEERQNLDLLRESYKRMADAYAKAGDKSKADAARESAGRVDSK